MDSSNHPLGSRKRWIAPGGFALCFVLGAFAFLGQGHAPTQPIAYNHAKHIANGLSCVDCHTGVETQARATLPSIDICMGCHAAALTKSAEEEKIRTLAAAHREADWIRLTRVPAHVYFSHRRHVAIAKMACATCHGAMEKLTSPPSKPFRVFTMDTCLECHQRNGGGTDCNDCHR